MRFVDAAGVRETDATEEVHYADRSRAQADEAVVGARGVSGG
jgi:hypothetical protein